MSCMNLVTVRGEVATWVLEAMHFCLLYVSGELTINAMNQLGLQTAFST